MVNMYAMEEQLRQRVEALRHDAELAHRGMSLRSLWRRRPAEPTADQMLRPASAQYGARIVRLSSFPAWSRGRSETMSTDRGRL